MQKCIIHHTGMFTFSEGFIKNNKVYFNGEEDKDKFYFEEEVYEKNLIQFEVNGKWGFADINTRDIVIEPLWDYAGPFYYGYSHVSLGVKVDIGKGIGNINMEGGKHGYIDLNGEIIIPLNYDDAEDIPYLKEYFKVTKNDKKGLIDLKNKIVVPFKWDHLETGYNNDLIFCGIEKRHRMTEKEYANYFKKLFGIVPDQDMYKEQGPLYNSIITWGVYDKNFNLIVPPQLDEKPIPYSNNGKKLKSYNLDTNYYLLKKTKKIWFTL